MKKKICVLATSPLTVNAFLRSHLEALSRDYDVTLVTNLSAMSPSENFGLARVRVLHTPIRRAMAPASDFSSLLSLYSLMRKENFDALLTVTPKAGMLGMLAGTLAGIPVRIHWFTGQLWATMRSLSRRVFKAVDGLIARLATSILVDSHSQLMFLMQEKFIAPGKTAVLGNGSISGVDTKRFRTNPRKRESIRAKFNISADTVLVVFLGRLNPDKGLRDLARAVSAADPGQKIALMCVGPDEGKMSARVRAVVEESGRRVHFVGATDSPEDYLAAGELLCLPSYREGFGTSVIEAAAVGVPAIVSDIYGLSDSVIDGHTGLCFPVKDVDALTAALNKMASSPALRKRLGDKARARAIAKFSSKFLTSELLRYVEAQLNQRASHNPSRGAN